MHGGNSAEMLARMTSKSFSKEGMYLIFTKVKTFINANKLYNPLIFTERVWFIIYISYFSSGEQIVSLYEALQTSEASPHLISNFEEVISALVSDVKKIDESKRNMEEKIKR